MHLYIYSQYTCEYLLLITWSHRVSSVFQVDLESMQTHINSVAHLKMANWPTAEDCLKAFRKTSQNQFKKLFAKHFEDVASIFFGQHDVNW